MMLRRLLPAPLFHVFAAALCACVLGCAPCAALEAPWTGKVIHVADGDTVNVLNARRESVRIRFSGIDAPEKNQPFGRRSKQALEALAKGRMARVVPVDTDKYGRSVARIEIDGRDIGLQMIASGLAWVYPKYVHNVPPALADSYLKAQASARMHRSGLWRDSRPVPPWEWRKLPKEVRRGLR